MYVFQAFILNLLKLEWRHPSMLYFEIYPILCYLYVPSCMGRDGCELGTANFAWPDSSLFRSIRYVSLTPKRSIIVNYLNPPSYLRNKMKTLKYPTRPNSKWDLEKENWKPTKHSSESHHLMAITRSQILPSNF